MTLALEKWRGENPVFSVGADHIKMRFFSQLRLNSVPLSPDTVIE
jgi:hypothetical protein